MPNKKARPTILMPGGWLARYEKYLVNISSYRGMVRQSKPLTNFFESYPKLHYPEEFSRLHVEDFLIVMAREGASKHQLRDARRAIAGMWRWMIDCYDLPLINIGHHVAEHTVPSQARSRLTLEEFERIYSEADNDAELRVYLEGLLYGEKRETGKCHKTMLRRFKATVGRIGLPNVRVSDIKRELRAHLWAELLRKQRPSQT